MGQYIPPGVIAARIVRREVLVAIVLVGCVGFVYLLCAAVGEAYDHGKADGYREAERMIPEFNTRLYGRED